jgi:hypothetical protein
MKSCFSRAKRRYASLPVRGRFGKVTLLLDERQVAGRHRIGNDCGRPSQRPTDEIKKYVA